MFALVRLSVAVALKTLGRHRFRTALTALGTVFGVATLLTVVALGMGAQAALEEALREAEVNVIEVKSGNYTPKLGVDTFIQAWEYTAFDPDTPLEPAGRGSAKTLTAADADAIQAEVTGVQYRAATITHLTFVSAGNTKIFTRVYGTDVELPRIYSWNALVGRFLDRDDVQAAVRSAVLGRKVSAKLFGPEVDPIGRTVRIMDQSFDVVGLTREGSHEFDEMVFVPFTTLQQLLGVHHLQAVIVASAEAAQSARVAKDITTLLRRRHKLDPERAAPPRHMYGPIGWMGMPSTGDRLVLEEVHEVPNDFTIRTQAGGVIAKGLTRTMMAFVLATVPNLERESGAEMLATINRADNTMAAFLVCTAMLSLIVGGIGIMNVMLVSVSERVREIGQRLMVGARAQDIFVQFVIEAATLGVIGGIGGVVLGATVARIVTSILGWPTVIAPTTVVVDVLVAAGIGVAFGFYPALRASRMNVIEAVRYE